MSDDDAQADPVERTTAPSNGGGLANIIALVAIIAVLVLAFVAWQRMHSGAQTGTPQENDATTPVAVTPKGEPEATDKAAPKETPDETASPDKKPEAEPKTPTTDG